MQDSPSWRPNNDPVMPKLLGAAWLAGDLADVVSVRRDLRWLRCVQHVPADVPQGHLRLLSDRRGNAHGRVRAGRGSPRPLGGTLSDRLGPRPVVLTSLGGEAVLAVVIALEPEPEIPAGLSFVLMAFFLGLGAGGVFTWALRAPANGWAPSPASSVQPEASAGSSRRWSWERRTTRRATTTPSVSDCSA